MKSAVLLPLYIYPDPHAWDPLYAAIQRHRSLEFLVIINPNSGPGAAPWWPNADYIREIPRLKTFPNVQLVGYVHATYCKRQLEHVLNDIETYAARATKQDGYGSEMEGIFVDETVNLYSPEFKEYLDRIDAKVKDTIGYGGKRLVIHNPGTSVNRQLAEPGPDITVVAETSYAEFVKKEYQDWLMTSPYDRSKACYIVHSVPYEKVHNVTLSLRERAAFLFVTSATTNFYGKFGDSWDTFIGAMTAP